MPLVHILKHLGMDKSTIIRSALSSIETKKKPKKSKKVNLIRNPFADPNTTLDHQQSIINGPCSRVVIGLRSARSPVSNDNDGNGDSDEEEDEERVIKARKDALATLDPTNSDPEAEFRPWRALSTNVVSFHKDSVPSDDYGSDRESVLRTPKANSEVPEIAILMATPSPPLSKKQDDRSTTLNMEGLQRVIRYPGSTESDTGVKSEDVEDHVGVATGRDPGACIATYSVWSPRRNTFGAPVLHGNRQPRQQCHRDSRPKTGFNHDAWDSDHDTLIPDVDVRKGGGSALLGQTEISLKGKVGGRRRSEDADATLITRGHGIWSLFGGRETEDWAMHPRTAAIRGTFHTVQNDAVPVPDKPTRPRSLGDEFTTIPLGSPPDPSTSALKSRNGAALSRTGSLDSSFHRLKEGASAPLMSFGSISTPDYNKDYVEARKYPSENQRTVQLANRHVQDDQANCRSSSMTFGIRRSLSNPLPMLPSFSSLRHLVSTAAGLGRSSSVPGNVSSPPSSPSTFPRSQTTFGGRYEFGFGGVSGGQVSFSPGRRYTPAIIPTIVIPPHVSDECSAPTTTTVSYASDPTRSSVTMFSNNYGLGRQGSDHTSVINSDPSAFENQRQPEGFLRVPEPARTVFKRQPSAMTIVDATKPAWSPKGNVLNRSPASESADSLIGPLMSDDYIDQFERARTLAWNKGMSATGVSSIPSTATLGTSANQDTDFMAKDNSMECTQATSGTGRLFGLFPGAHGKSRHGRQMSGHTDISEKLMQLPEPSRFEGMCSGRGMINITSMLLIMCGLVLLVLVYPIAASLRKDQLVEEAASGLANNGTGLNQIKFTMANSTAFLDDAVSQVGGGLPQDM